LSNGYQISSEYERIKTANTNLTDLLTSTGLFNTVLRGFPEDLNVYKGAVATSYVQGAGFRQTMGEANRPEKLNTLIGIIVKGTKTEAHDLSLDTALTVLSNFRTEPDWLTLKDEVRNTQVADFKIYPEKTKKGLLTTSIIQLEHHILW
jgi:hypothetical protein